ncbi:MAG: FAD/NAD(P)-binding protein [Gemmatimonadota bacterium]
MLDWLIVGGGIHGVHIAARLIGERGVDPARVAVVDPADRLLDRWRARADTVGMTHLRSPSVHHLGLTPQALVKFAGDWKRRRNSPFAGSYSRPTLELFNAHCDHVLKTFSIDDRHVQDHATRGAVRADRVAVGLRRGGELEARNVVLAVGSGERPSRPEWAPDEHPRIHHIFDPAFSGWPTSTETVVVVGGGLSAAQVALRLLADGHDVRLVSRHPLREHRFDSEPGWLGPKYMAGFAKERDYDRRRAVITEARHRGSVPPVARLALCGAINRGDIVWHEGSVESLRTSGKGVLLRLSDRSRLYADRLLLATGFAPARPGGSLVDSLVESASLPCARCGYPIVDSRLHWHPRVRVSGALAELELGPVARNIAGARRAGDRLVRGEWLS